MLGGNVCRQSFKTNKTSDRRAVDDGTFTLYKHFNFMLHAEPNPFQVYGNGFIQFSSVQSAVEQNLLQYRIVKGIIHRPK
jgi:hypothetical protein